MRPKKNIYLSGFMGVGKSTVGKILANKLSCPFVDTDSLIEKKLNMSVRTIFTKKGEPFFRECERKVLAGERLEIPKVVSLGGGVVLNSANREILRSGFWINLKATPPILSQRIKNQKKRPLLAKKSKKGSINREGIEELLRGRRPYYDLAPFQIETDRLTPDAIADIILKKTRVPCKKSKSR